MNGKQIGTLYGIGVGPGDPELLTLKGYRYITECPVIAYPKKKLGEPSYALGIVEKYVDSSEKTMLGLVFPMTRNPEILHQQWNDTVDAVWNHLSKGENVAFVTEGDPMIFSTFIHLSRVLRERYKNANIVSIPGVSSMNAAASSLHIPYADGDESIAIVPATNDKDKMRAVLQMHDCVVFIKVAKVFDQMVDLLAESHLLDKSFAVTKVTAPDEMIWRNVEELRGEKLSYLTLMVVRK